MKGNSAATTPEEYISSLEEPRKSEIQTLYELIRETVPQFEPHIRSGMIGFGTFTYKGAGGRDTEWFRVGLASNKASISVYACSVNAEGYVAQKYRARLPKASIGQSCIRVKKLADLDLDVLRELLRESATLGCSM